MTIQFVIVIVRLIGFLWLWAFLSMPGHAIMVLKQWDAVTTNTDGSPCTDLAGYRLFTATNSLSVLIPDEALANPAIVKTNISSAATSTSVDLAEDATYYFRLTAFNAGADESAFSNEVSTYLAITTPPDISSPTLPTDLTASNVGNTAFTLGWTASTDNVGVAGYLLDVSLDPSFSSFVNSYNNRNLGSVLSADVSGLLPQTAYYARLRAYDVAGNISINSVAVYTMTGQGQLSPPGITVGPNILRPSRNPGSVVTFRNLAPGARARIYTLTGNLVYEQIADNGQAVWAGLNRSGKAVASGIYTVVIESGKDKKVLRVAVER